MPRRIYLDNDDEPEVDITRKNTTTGVEEAAVGLTVTVHLATSRGGAAIHADLNKSATERSSKDGTYFAIMEGDNLRTHIADNVGDDLYYVWISGSDVKANEPVRVEEHQLI